MLFLFMADLFKLTQEAILGLNADVELIDVERAPLGLLRITIDTPTGVKIEDCEQVSRHLSRVYEVENIDYQRLEVSSPGLDRPLRNLADFERFSGERIELKLHEAVDNKKTFRGVLQNKGEGRFSLEIEEKHELKELVFTLDEVLKAKLDPVLNFKGKK